VQFFQGDNVSGTFGLAGSNTTMVFLVFAALAWVALALHRRIPSWSLWIVGPAVVVPMALGSVALFVILLPAALAAVLVRAAAGRGTRVTSGALVGGVLVICLVGWTARAYSLAPGFAGAKQRSAESVLSQEYLRRYLRASEEAGSRTRLGFLSTAVDATFRTGATPSLVGRGPQAGVIGAPDEQVTPTATGVLATASVQSLPRMLLAFGLLGVLAYVFLVMLCVVPARRRRPRDPAAAALLLILPVAAAIYVATSLYNAPWTDPGVACAFWALVASAYAGSAEPMDTVPGSPAAVA
jgi:hypothetical protein